MISLTESPQVRIIHILILFLLIVIIIIIIIIATIIIIIIIAIIIINNAVDRSRVNVHVFSLLREQQQPEGRPRTWSGNKRFCPGDWFVIIIIMIVHYGDHDHCDHYDQRIDSSSWWTFIMMDIMLIIIITIKIIKIVKIKMFIEWWLWPRTLVW